MPESDQAVLLAINQSPILSARDIRAEERASFGVLVQLGSESIGL